MRFKALNIVTGEYTEYESIEEKNQFDMFVEAVLHVEVRTGRKVVAYMTSEYFNKLSKDKYFDMKVKNVKGFPISLDNEQDCELILKY